LRDQIQGALRVGGFFPVGGFSPRSDWPVVKTTVFQTPSLSVGGFVQPAEAVKATSLQLVVV
jgi:hypothetical protein